MSDLLRRIRLPALFAGLLLATLALMIGDKAALEEGGRDHGPGGFLLGFAARLQQVVTAPADFLAGTWQRYVSLVTVSAENEILAARIAELEEDNLQLREALVASGHLQRIAEMRADFEVPLLPSQVVGHDHSPWFRSVLLDRGQSDAVRAGMPVVTDRGLMGVVTATSGGAARAMMLLDRRSAADAIVQRSRARGIVRGSGGDELELVFMVRGDDVRPGDEVITSGVGGVYPKGLRIGEVVAVQTDRDELLHTAVVRPSVDFGRLEQVFVMQRRAQTLELLYGGSSGDVAAEPPPETP
ncbi:MAG: rod shape-determining protein MreC [Myxococcota bacterium]|nr:rod shape-determining protein MreC [Myxococcota bacterium]